MVIIITTGDSLICLLTVKQLYTFSSLYHTRSILYAVHNIIQVCVYMHYITCNRFDWLRAVGYIDTHNTHSSMLHKEKIFYGRSHGLSPSVKYLTDMLR